MTIGQQDTRDFRDEFQINARGPIKLNRPVSNQQLQHANSFIQPPGNFNEF